MLDIKIPKRTELGLLDNVVYVLNEHGGIDWRKMIPKEFLTLNLQHREKLEELFGKSINDIKVEEVEDKYLLILLGGVKELARLRGFNRVEYQISPVGETFVAASCSIEWIPNFETEFRTIIFGDGGDATNSNTNGFGKSYLTAMAVNRAFVRAVKNFLNINILGKDEIPTNAPPIEEPTEEEVGPHGLLLKVMNKAGLTFEKIKKNEIAKGLESAEQWTCLYDIPKVVCFDIMGRINKKVLKN